MPGPIKRYRSDPNSKGRGGGLYYHRGKGVYSKYKATRDKYHNAPKPRKAKNHKPGKIGMGSYKQTHDRGPKKTHKKKR